MSAGVNEAQTIAVLYRLLEQSTLPIAIADMKGRVTVFNAAAERLTGYAAEEVLGEPVALFSDSPAVTAEIADRVLEDGKIEDFETTLRSKDGRRIPISLMATMLADESSEPFGMMALIKDLSERHGLEESLRLAKQRADFSNDLMTHDIRNYAQTIGGYLDALLAGQVGGIQAPQARILKVCRRQAQRIEGLIDNLQLLLHAHDGCQAGEQTALQAWPLAPALENAFKRTRDRFAERHVVLHRSIPADSAVLACVHFPRVLDNLFANAVGHNPSHEPHIWITAESATVNGAPGWAIGVADDGPGIGPESRTRLLNTSRPFEPGDSGVGLWVIKALLHNCGGTLQCEDRVDGEPEKGTRFIALLSAAPEPALAQAPPPEDTP